MATRDEYDRAVAAVKAGGGNRRDIELVEREAKQAGSRGNAAREALRKASKKR